MLRFKALLLLCLLPTLLSAAPHAGSADWDRIPQHRTRDADLQALRAALSPPATRGPARLAINLPLELDLADGAWTVSGDAAVWRARLRSPGAEVLIPIFDRFDLPAGAALYVSSADGGVVQGPYTADSANDRGGLMTAMVPGEEALLELHLPAARRGDADLHLARLGHGSLRADDEVEGKSGSCNIDVVCAAGDGWRDQIRASVRIQYPLSSISTGLCSGQLVNNSAQDGSPYVLTAHHCGITNARAQDAVVYFNYQTSTCGGRPNGSLLQNVSGASTLFSHARSDHTLLLLDAIPPRSYSIHYSGFNASTSALPQSGRAIHHPRGDEKRISVYDTPSVKRDINLEGVTVESFRIVWADGVTEPGSSGGGLWNQNRELVGLLSGGNTSCALPNGEDFFGRLERAWDSGLRPYLDPAGTGSRSMSGRNAATGDTGAAGRAALQGNGGVTNPGTSSGGTPSGGGGGGGSFGAGGLLLLALIAALRRRR